MAELPAGTEALCVDTDGDTQPSQSSESGVSLSDNAASQSSDAVDQMVIAPTDGGHDGDSGEDQSGESDSDGGDCGTGARTDGGGGKDEGPDTDGDGTSDSQDCDCVDPDGPPTGDPGPTIP